MIKYKSDLDRAVESIAETLVIRGSQLFTILLGLGLVYMGGKLIYALPPLGLPASTNFILGGIGVFFIVIGIVIGIVAVVKWKTLMISWIVRKLSHADSVA